MLKVLSIAIGGAAGAVLRYWVSGLTHHFFGSAFPWGTLAVNLIGSFLIGLLWGLFESVVISQNIRLLIFVGILGSFTTFATFSLENFNLARDSQFAMLFLNICVSVILCLALVFAGYFLARSFLDVTR